MTVTISWRQALAWRMRRQLLDPVGSPPVADVVRSLCAVQTQVASSAELAVRVRRQASRPGEVGKALSDGRLIKTWAMRGTLHLLTPEEGGAFLSLLNADGHWDAWRRYLGLTARQMDTLRRAILSALEGPPLTRVELADAIGAQRGVGRLGEALRESWGGILKPLAWQGELCFGPSQGTRVTFTRPQAVSSRWAGVPDPDEAAPGAIAAYFRAYGPATIDTLQAWLHVGKRRLRSWYRSMGDRLVEITVDGDSAQVLAEDVDELVKTRPTNEVRLLPGFDQYVLGSGTKDGHVVPAARRLAVSRQAGWISPVVVAGGVVRGTWALERDQVSVAWFKEAGKPPRGALRAEVTRLSSILERDLRATILLA